MPMLAMPVATDRRMSCSVHGSAKLTSSLVPHLLNPPARTPNSWSRPTMCSIPSMIDRISDVIGSMCSLWFLVSVAGIVMVVVSFLSHDQQSFPISDLRQPLSISSLTILPYSPAFSHAFQTAQSSSFDSTRFRGGLLPGSLVPITGFWSAIASPTAHAKNDDKLDRARLAVLALCLSMMARRRMATACRVISLIGVACSGLK